MPHALFQPLLLGWEVCDLRVSKEGTEASLLGASALVISPLVITSRLCHHGLNPKEELLEKGDERSDVVSFKLRDYWGTFVESPWRRNRQPTPIVLLRISWTEESTGGYSTWDHKESNTAERLNRHALSVETRRVSPSHPCLASEPNRLKCNIFTLELCHLCTQMPFWRKHDIL